MKRRTFVTLSSTIGMASAVSGASVLTSAYSSMNNSILLEEFNVPTKNVLDNFIIEVTQNVKSLGLDIKLVKDLVSPVQIIKNDSTNDGHNIMYKNKAGNHISISVAKEKKQIKISN
ncbi:MAG: hypothetical protein AB8H03_23735 [Saprospiraceae bacterium]